MGEAAQSFFTAGFPCYLEPLPILSYDVVPAADTETSDSGDELSAGQGMRLQPELTPCDVQPWPVIARELQTDSFQHAVACWAKIFVMLDAADPDAHFTALRRFFDARLPTTDEGGRSSPTDERGLATSSHHERDVSGSGVERRSSFVAPHRFSRRMQWTRRPSLPTGGNPRSPETSGQPLTRSFFGSVRRSSRRMTASEAGTSTEMCELWVAPPDDDHARSVPFHVRLDLHNVHLAPAPPGLRHRRAGASLLSTRTDGEEGEAPAGVAGGPSLDEAPVSEASVSSGVRRSLLNRMLDRHLRRGSHTQAHGTTPLPEWMRPGSEPHDLTAPENAEALESDDEVDRRDAERLWSMGARRSSGGSHAVRAAPTAAGHNELGRVEEDSLWESAGEQSSSRRGPTLDGVATPTLDEDVPDVAENEDLLSLLRAGSMCVLQPGAQQREPAWNRGVDDALPAIFSCAMAQAFGWEGVLHLCYGPGSLCAQEQVYAPLGRAADLDSHLRRKFDAVLSWRSNVMQSTGAEDAPPPAADAQAVSVPAADEAASLATGVSEGDSAQRPSPGAPWLARHTLRRTWADWSALFASLYSWVSEYETVRIRHSLAHEMGRETLPPLRGVTGAHARGRAVPSACVEADAVQGVYGFQRLGGVPEALRVAPGGEEHGDYRWARTRLRSSHVRTPIMLSCASAQFVLQQLATSRWVFERGWELEYLNKCIFDSTMFAERFPPPGDQVVQAARAYRPKPGELDIGIPCPYPSPSGAWSAAAWKSWLSTIKEGHVIVPAVDWQAWWVLIAVLNGADRSGRWYDLQVKTPQDTFENLEHTSVYI
ncbi:hypothetical protein MBRA1_001465 [Malassezia brasiliensis]|uniref:Uncharacterized protein n=1 Tax=Malassezia brasiliensis TaxID=1821822 RepID=A0AAF0IN86_9BASI|nr:hypothetical protein MBRA1_001465 [Malassezia brasiliensis]